ncbi:MAG: hypothetical protein JWM57_4131 [Phycisphaerales bacterium]|nr:hypothetical protein [Phycisphaerales bacterium]
MIQAEGRYARTWTNAAAKNMVRQIPLIAESFPSIVDYYPATLNVVFGPMIIVAGSDCRTPPLQWKAIGEDGETGEVFDLVRCRLTIGNQGPLNALMYVGHWSLHRLDPHKQEFLAEGFIDGLTDGMAVTFTCDRPAIELPYTKSAQTGDIAPLARTIVIL